MKRRRIELWAYALVLLPTVTELAEEGRLPTEPREFVTDVAITIIIAIFVRELLRAHAKLVTLSETDGLTDLKNKRVFERDLTREVTRAHRTGTKLAMAFIDVDGLKTVNDRYGHRTGDRVLSTVGTLLKDCFRNDVDQSYRVGGDEFVLLLPTGTNATFRDIEKRIWTLKEHGRRRLSPYGADLSVGATVLRDAESATSFFSRADTLMYRQKAGSGRN